MPGPGRGGRSGGGRGPGGGGRGGRGPGGPHFGGGPRGHHPPPPPPHFRKRHPGCLDCTMAIIIAIPAIIVIIFVLNFVV